MTAEFRDVAVEEIRGVPSEPPIAPILRGIMTASVAENAETKPRNRGKATRLGQNRKRILASVRPLVLP